ncbi:Spy/CpxP family protein refolding chaperone [Pinirhizobacter soli]|uniref:Spy/CpxP family protein refolding chaperone n=1 Tax=Pinirhizobacter soli TaxID=2786953 RepID=UPI002029B8E4|nr:Spy/CpxP family protein refolding chaperone [Pinirhizobacter soli]
MKNAIRKVAVPALLSLALLAPAAWAQQSATPSGAATSSTPTKSHAERRADSVERRINELHTQLAITDPQSSQWNAFAQIMRDNALNTGQAFHERSQKLSSMSAPDAMKSYADLTQLHADNMKKLSSSFSDLYAVLSDEQKKTADTLYRNQKLAHGKGHHGPHKGGKPASSSSAG